MQSVTLGGIHVDLMEVGDAVQHIASRAEGPAGAPGVEPLAVITAGRDHLAYFGDTGPWYDTLDYRLGVSGAVSSSWLTLVDDPPLVARAERLTQRAWPRLAGRQLIGPLLDEAEARGTTVGFLGGSPEHHRLLSRTLTRTRPGLMVAGMWSPELPGSADPDSSRDVAESIRSAQVQLLVVGLGKPQQELWIAEYGPLTGCNVLLAAADVMGFLAAGSAAPPLRAAGRDRHRPSRPVAAYRPATRQLLGAPSTSFHPFRNSFVWSPVGRRDRASIATALRPAGRGAPDGSFAAPDEPADVVVLVVTYNSAGMLDTLISGLRHEARSLRLRVVVADNDSRDGTLEALSAYPDVIALPTGGNLGYAAAINAARRLSGRNEAVLVLNPDLMVEPGAISSLHQRMVRSGAGIVVPQLLEDDGVGYPSLRHEPTILNALGDALVGSRLRSRPRWLSEMVHDPESYRHPHRIQWATGAALLVSAELAEQLGDWDEQFFLYSEEVDYCRRAREAGASLWYEPSARMTHSRGGSGASSELNALMAVNRIRYVRKYHPARYASVFRSVLVLSEVLRLGKPGHRGLLRTLVDERRWDDLPGPTASLHAAQALERFPRGVVVIPAHNEAAVIARTLAPLSPLAAAGRIELIVACNGCTDATADIARGFEGVTVIETGTASKTAALNAGDAAASAWPRVYLDADIGITPAALRMVLSRLGGSSQLAARPAFRYDLSEAGFLVRAYYRARRRLPSTKHALWGAGVYGLAEAGHARFDVFPVVTADDLLVERMFVPSEKAIVNTPPVSVRTPRTPSSLLGILNRTYRGNAELNQSRATAVHGAAGGTWNTVGELLTSIRGPVSAFDALVYGAFVALARRRASRQRSRGVERAWERDESSRHQ